MCCDPACVRPDQPGYAIEQSGLPCSRRTKQDRDPRRKREGEIKLEIFSQPLANLHRRFCSSAAGSAIAALSNDECMNSGSLKTMTTKGTKYHEGIP